MDNLSKGIVIEDFIAKQLKASGSFEIEQNHTWGVDIELITPMKKIKIEVKSANYIVKNGKKGTRKGVFSFYPNNIEKPDYFALVVCKDNGKKTHWVCGDVIRKHFVNRKRNSEKSKFTMGIPTLMTRIKKVDFSEVVNF